MKYSKIEHAKLIAQIISRMANNHTKWLFTLFTIIGFSVALDKFIFDIDNNIRVYVSIVVATITIILMVVSLLTSRAYFSLENAYRDKQKLVLDGEFNSYDLKPDKTKNTRSTSWIINVGFLIISLYFVAQLSLVVYMGVC